MDLLPDDDAAKAILKDVEESEAAMKAQLQATFDQWRASTEQVKKSLARKPAQVE